MKYLHSEGVLGWVAFLVSGYFWSLQRVCQLYICSIPRSGALKWVGFLLNTCDMKVIFGRM